MPGELGALELAGSIGGISAAIWLWRFSKIAMVVKMLAMMVILAVVGNFTGIVEVTFNLDRAVELVQVGIDLVGGML